MKEILEIIIHIIRLKVRMYMLNVLIKKNKG